MIQYFSRQGLPPPWLVGASNLCTREVRDGFSFGIGEGFYLSSPPEITVPVSDGFVCWMNKDGAEPELLYRVSPWFRTQLVSDGNERIWTVPVILDANGKRGFKVSYGKDWKPALTPTQEDLLKVADEIGIFLDGVDNSGEIEDPSFGCAAAARLLEQSNHITMEVIGGLHLMDDILMLGTLMKSTSRTARQEGDHG